MCYFVLLSQKEEYYDNQNREVVDMVINLAEKKEGFVPNTDYSFDPPVETNCILFSGKCGWVQKKFSEGWCLRFENGIGVFQGKPVGEELVYFFQVDYGSGGSVAVNKGSSSQG